MEMLWQAVEKCSGCGACKNICPMNCIEIVEKSGCVEPKKEKALCINCNMCIHVCPILNKQYPKVYAAHALDENILNSSSSGGVAPLLAEYIIAQGGVVFGAAFDQNFGVHHIAIEKMDELDKIRRSKYVQSRIENSFQKVAEYLMGKRTVLFTGTGCQIAGLLSYLKFNKIDTMQLYTQDIICHGVVLPEIWRKYIEEKEKEYDSKIKEVSFRDKKNGWLNYSIKIIFENGQIYHMSKDTDLYMKIFLSNICLNESCYSCNFRGEQRVADITLGDFWNVHRIAPECFLEDGISVVMVNSLKGQKLIENIQHQLFIKEVNIQDITRSETMLVTTVKKHLNRNKFLDMIGETSLEEAYSKCSSIQFGVIGSYNARCVAKRCGNVVFQISNTSLISLFSNPIVYNGLEIENNKFREQMLKLDFSKEFILYFNEYIKKTDMLLIDFLEERFGVIPLNNSYVTDSDAFNDAKLEIKTGNKIGILNNTYFESWKMNCEKFVDLLAETVSHQRVILIKMFLSEKDSTGNYFKEIKEIRKVNSILEKMYIFFQKKCYEMNFTIQIVEIAHSLFYAQKEHVYGCYPWHFNTRAEQMGAAILGNRISDTR